MLWIQTFLSFIFGHFKRGDDTFNGVPTMIKIFSWGEEFVVVQACFQNGNNLKRRQSYAISVATKWTILGTAKMWICLCIFVSEFILASLWTFIIVPDSLWSFIDLLNDFIDANSTTNFLTLDILCHFFVIWADTF